MKAVNGITIMLAAKSIANSFAILAAERLNFTKRMNSSASTLS